jgi:hypothetical protein
VQPSKPFAFSGYSLGKIAHDFRDASLDFQEPFPRRSRCFRRYRKRLKRFARKWLFESWIKRSKNFGEKTIDFLAKRSVSMAFSFRMRIFCL